MTQPTETAPADPFADWDPARNWLAKDSTLVSRIRRQVQVIPPDFDNLLTINFSNATSAKDGAARLRADFAEYGEPVTRPEIEVALKRCRIRQIGLQ